MRVGRRSSCPPRLPKPAPKAANGPPTGPLAAGRARAFPAADLRHPHRPVPRPPHPDGVQRGAIGHRHRPGLYVPLGSPALARPAAAAPPEGDRSPRGSAGDRATRTRPPGQETREQGTKPPRRTRHGQPRRGPGPSRPPGTAPRSNPPPHQTPGSHPALRPAGLTGTRQATRQPSTVRGRRLDKAMSC